MRTLAEYRAPKQRMTREYKIVMAESHSQAPDRFSVHRVYLPDGDMDAGSYVMTAEEAWAEFHLRIKQASGYGPATWEV